MRGSALSRIVRACPRVVAVALAGACVTSAPAAAAPLGARTLDRGDRGGDVRAMQRLLTRAGLATPATGYFGTMSERNVRRLERRLGRRPDGRLTPAEARALRFEASSGAAAARRPAKGSLASSALSIAARTGGAAPIAPTAPAGGKARLLPDGTAVAPADAPASVRAVIAAGNRIAHKPYRYGGGHARFPVDSGYDCSGSVSYALHGGRLLRSPMPSSGFYSYGRAGKGRWITIYTHGGHIYMVVAGLRFDTSGARADGSRWHATMRSPAGFQVRHPAGL